ncbi:AAA family ATPase [Vineibacter terrae]|uniref:AAA family ATPase n=1 Tax=Vineibacter terrae TaxID=2586908 RepID=UPI002E2F1C02|nr:AAA family ATPase [Vineibacter terrae]HEX2890103.1 AAA family ATPase [Vineibacter terrae]
MIDDILRTLAGHVAGDGRFILVLAGPNGAGKSTFHDLHVRPLGLPFVNADLIAGDLDTPDAAQRARQAAAQADAERQLLVTRGDAFCMETVFSDPVGAKLDFLRDAQRAGYEVILIFIGLQSAALSLARVVQRVAQGGHDVPEARLAARYPRTLANLQAAIGFVDIALLLDNSDVDLPYRFVALYERGRRRKKARRLPDWARPIAD